MYFFGPAASRVLHSPIRQKARRFHPLSYRRQILKLSTSFAPKATNNERENDIRFFSTTNEGEILYQQALSRMNEAKDLESKREKERSNMMYDAWQRARENDLNSKSQGVTVVKTLQKSVRNDRAKTDDAGELRKDAIQLLKEAAKKHSHPEAAIQLGNMILKDLSRKIDPKAKNRYPEDPKDLISEALELFERAGDAGSRVGWYNLGHLLWTGFPPLADSSDDGAEGSINTNDVSNNSEAENDQVLVSDAKAAMSAFYKAIELGDSDAMYFVGVHWLGGGDHDSIEEGIDFIRQAADAGHGGALYYLALLHLNGEPETGIQPCGLDEFVHRLDQAVDAGSEDAMFVRANSLYHGTEGYPQDFKRALQDFVLAADNGHADSAVSAGAMFHNGVGVLRDQRKAFEFYQLGGELGSLQGWVNVVDCWQKGLGVPKSEETARYIKETMLKGQI